MTLPSFKCSCQSGNIPSIISSRWDSVIDITSPVDCPFVIERHLTPSVSINVHTHWRRPFLVALYSKCKRRHQKTAYEHDEGPVDTARFVVLVNPITYFGIASRMLCGARVGTIRVTLRSAAS